MVSMRVAALCSLVACSFNSSVPAASGLADDGTTSEPVATTTDIPPSTSGPTGTIDTSASTALPTTSPPPDTASSSEETGTSECFADPNCLVSHGLVARYVLDEAPDGQAPAFALDSAPDPENLVIAYSDVLTYTQTDGNRGLGWTAPADDARASVAVDGTKFADLGGSTTATWEVVVAIDNVTNLWSRIVHIGSDDNSGSFTLSTPAADQIHFRFAGSGGPWESISVPTLAGRTVVHLVFDSNATDVADRARFYIDGEPVNPAAARIIPLGEPIPDLDGEHLVLGNREIGQRTFDGTLFYAALYDRALGPDAVAHNAARLMANDDS